jgi:hypothetical protein
MNIIDLAYFFPAQVFSRAAEYFEVYYRYYSEPVVASAFAPEQAQAADFVDFAPGLDLHVAARQVDSAADYWALVQNSFADFAPGLNSGLAVGYR